METAPEAQARRNRPTARPGQRPTEAPQATPNGGGEAGATDAPAEPYNVHVEKPTVMQTHHDGKIFSPMKGAINEEHFKSGKSNTS